MHAYEPARSRRAASRPERSPSSYASAVCAGSPWASAHDAWKSRRPHGTRDSRSLSLVADGLRNGEIAERLFVSRRPVDHHVSTILRKLDAKTAARPSPAHAAQACSKTGSDSAI